jgi:Na+/H+-dicarboxylate symporter
MGIVVGNLNLPGIGDLRRFKEYITIMLVSVVFVSLTADLEVESLGAIGWRGVALILAVMFVARPVAIMLAIALALLIGPGAGFDMQGVDVGGVTGKAAPSVWEVFANIVPSNPIQALANGEMLQIIFYVIVVGIAALMLGSESEGFVRACEYMNDLMMKVVTIVMHFAPYGVFALIARTFAQQGIDLFIPVLAYVVTLVAALAIHLFGTLMVMLKLFTGLSPLTFLRKIRPAQLFAFSTASSNATIPVTLRSVTARVGVDNSVASFTVPFGATINMDGTAIMQGVATVFLANVYGVALGLTGYATVILMAVLASIGTAGVPGVGLVMLTMVLGQVGLPIEGIALILGVDRLMDMMRTVVNISGDAVVTTIVAKSEGKVDLAVFDDPNAGIL